GALFRNLDGTARRMAARYIQSRKTVISAEATFADNATFINPEAGEAVRYASVPPAAAKSPIANTLPWLATHPTDCASTRAGPVHSSEFRSNDSAISVRSRM